MVACSNETTNMGASRCSQRVQAMGVSLTPAERTRLAHIIAVIKHAPEDGQGNRIIRYRIR